MTVVAIDGPSAAGKSTVAKAVAGALGFRFVDTGAMYRALAVAALERGLDPADERAMEELAASVKIDADEARVTVDGHDVTSSIRSEAVGRAAAISSAHEGVRRVMVARQRELAHRSDVVMEGRDIGSIVVPDATVKIFLTADLQERARRRSAELHGSGNTSDLEGIAEAIAARDARDRTRQRSPLVKASDAVEIDSTDRSVDEVVAEIAALVRARS